MFLRKIEIKINSSMQTQIPVIVDSPVGNNLQDHPLLLLNVCINDSKAITVEKALSISSIADYLMNRKGKIIVIDFLVHSACIIAKYGHYKHTAVRCLYFILQS